jgi:hypothetical protein
MFLDKRLGCSTGDRDMPYDGQFGEHAQLGAGRVWLIEPPTTGGLSARASGALAGADVILYDRVFAPIVADLLPAGSYAEPLSAELENGAPEISTRARQLAADGWCVVQLVPPCQQRSPERADAPGEDVLTLYVGPLGGRAAALANAFTANGLAG